MFIRRQFTKFVIIGVINTSFSYLIYAYLVFLGVNFAIANLCALVIGILFSFKTQGHFVFASSGNRRFGRFVLSWTLIYLVTIVIIGQLLELGMNAYYAGALALPFTTVSSYLAQKYFVFRAPIHSKNNNEVLQEKQP